MQADPGFRVKITVKVTPNDGSKPVVINQMIKANIIENQTEAPEPIIMTGNGGFGGNTGGGSGGGGGHDFLKESDDQSNPR